MTIAEMIALVALLCNIILTALALWRACQTRTDVGKLKRHIMPGDT